MRLGLASLAAVAACCVCAGNASAAITSTWDSVTGTLTVSSTAGDGIAFSCSGTKVRVNFAAVTGDPACSAVDVLNVNGGPQGNNIDLQGANSSNYPSATPITVNGNGGGDSVAGSNQAETIDGGDGNDFIDGGPGNDTVRTSDEGGPDDLSGGTGTTDTLVVFGSAAQSAVVSATEIGTNGNPITFSGFDQGQFDTPNGEPTLDLTNAPWPSTVNGGADFSNETVYTSAFNDVLNLGNQGIEDIVATRNDPVTVTVTAGSLSGTGIGNDTLNSSVERVRIISPTATALGPAVDSTWDASLFSGKVTMTGGTGNDTLIGGSGNDQLGEPSPNPAGFVESGDDTFTGNAGSNQAGGGAGTDTLRATAVTTATASASSVTVNGAGNTLTGVERAQLTGSGNADIINLTNWTGQAILDGSGGGDVLAGGTGDDRITGGAGAESGVIDGNGGTDTLAETATAPTAGTVTNGSLTGFGGSEAFAEVERVELTGSSGVDDFNATGFTGVAIFDGRGGADTLTGGLGADALLGGADADTLNAQADNAADTTVDCGSETDTANVDLTDPATAGCETVNKPSVPDPDPGTGTDPGTGPGTGPGSQEVLGTQTVIDRIAPAVTVKAGRVNRRGRIPLRFSCPATESSCSGTFRLLAKNKKGKTITVGRGSFTVQGGKVAAVQVKLSRTGRALLRTRRKLKVTVAMTAADAAGNSSATRPGLTLRPAPKGR